jgi:hypothetical protein
VNNPNRKRARIAFVGGASLALLAGCAEAPVSQPVPSTYDTADALAAVEREAAYIEAFRRQFPVEPDDAPAVQAPRRKRSTLRRAPVDDSPVVSENPPAKPAPVAKETPVAKAPADPSCVGWWRVCHFL